VAALERRRLGLGATPQVIEKTPAQKLAEFLATNPDVQSMLG
jgi:hypothetical protein